MSLPKDFFTQLEQYSELSNREKAVFVEIFGNSKSRIEVTQAFHISESNLSSCLTGIYKKFSISGRGPVKETRLREYLQKRYSQQKSCGKSTADVAKDDIDALVQEIREQVKPSIKEKCGTMRVLDMDQPIKLTGERGIYTNVNILEKTTKRRRVKIVQLLPKFDREDFEHFGLHKASEKRVPGLQAVQYHNKLMVLGKPGANWQFSDRQAKILQQYYNSNKLLVNCLNSDCNISEKVRQGIEHNLLLPISKLETENNTEIF